MNTTDQRTANEATEHSASEERRAAIERVQAHALPDDIEPLVDDYEEIVGDRDRFLWKWAHHLFPKFTLSCVPPEHTQITRDTKLEGLIFVSILDDVAEKHQDWATFEEAAKIPFDHRHENPDREGVDERVVAFARDVWERFAAHLAAGPRAAEFDRLIRFDLKQVCTAMEYSYLTNQDVDALTRGELQRYDSHNMMLYGFADVDLSYSPGFDRTDLATLRRIVERAQRMVRIGNWISTWERELSEGDFTSGIVAYALEEELVSPSELTGSRTEGEGTNVAVIRQRIREHDVEAVFVEQWEAELAAAREFEGDVESVDVAAYLDGIERIMEYHLASRGLK